jgi:hypothetical protein
MAQTQLGLDIVGESIGDKSGYAVSMPDAYTIATGAPLNDGNGNNAGHVRVFEWSVNNWIQKGSDIDGDNPNDNSGYSLCMPDANTIAIGSPFSNADNSGQVRIFIWSGTTWTQKGSSIYGESAGDNFGNSVSMPDENTIAVGAWQNGGNGSSSGHVRIFTWNGSDWTQKGIDIDGEAANDNSGLSISMPDINTIAIGSPYNGLMTGHVRIFSWSGSAWTQKGNNIVGEATLDLSGTSIDMYDANNIIIGAPLNDGNGSNAGHARIYYWNGNSWVQKGDDIEGSSIDDKFGYAVSMGDANTVAIGAPENDYNGNNAGAVKFYEWNGTNWIQKGNTIYGEASDDQAGSRAISMPNANTAAIGAELNDGNGTDAGHVRIYNQITLNIENNDSKAANLLFPNPTSDSFTITGININSIKVYDIKGRLVVLKVHDSNFVTVDVSNLETGIYTVFINESNKVQLLIKQ